MGGTLDYDEAEARQEEAIYRTPAAAARRERVRGLLAPEPGDTVLSIGCGPGFEPAEIGWAVGNEGHVHGIDRSQAMLELARERCASLPQVTVSQGDAGDLPVADESVDAAVAVQVFEYLETVSSAVAELARVLRPGGSAVVCDADFASLVWRSPNPERMARVLRAFDDHCPQPRLGSRLAPVLREAGLTVDRVEPNTIVNTRLEEETFAYHLMQFIEDYAADHGAIGRMAAQAWANDLREQEVAGETFFSFTQYCYLVRKPASR
ncbi:methyltransferase family protein [Haloarcula quadrata]|jgi:ubiquinone/menaquinone biosynthesis C-methylase UbiE|uniref:Methyltransferase family protein n=1 Tax=Haloarcula quadrata TaxID=182779 RepID=A0A495R550_9EURY|nr:MULTISPECIES: class I SAM-dependent methyltransferase [Haloarcula]NHN62783.1 class I SAM-dependent methyltransferase [Haloarcula sp. JP-Z28]RKS82457.1 methyltransferase family protein [Haloarcula quadrata]